MNVCSVLCSYRTIPKGDFIIAHNKIDIQRVYVYDIGYFCVQIRFLAVDLKFFSKTFQACIKTNFYKSYFFCTVEYAML